MHRTNRGARAEGRKGVEERPAGILETLRRKTFLQYMLGAAAGLGYASVNNAIAGIEGKTQMRECLSEVKEGGVPKPRVGGARIPDKRGLFVYFDDLYAQNGGIDGIPIALDNMECAGFNIILLQAITSRGYSNFKDSLVAENRDVFDRVGPGRDPFAELISGAEARNIHVWPWMPLFIGNARLRREHPEWFAVSAYGNHSNFMDLLNPGARRYQIEAITHLIRKYRVQGINLDVELPVDHISYSEYDKKAFMEENGISWINWRDDVKKGGKYNELWLKWVNRKLIDFLVDLHREIRKVNKDIVISYDVTRNPNDPRYYDWWVSWLKSGATDDIAVMIYCKDSGFGVRKIREITRRDVLLARRENKNVGVISIVGGSSQATKGTSSDWWVSGIENAIEGNPEGLAVFWYGGLDRANAWADIGKLLRG